MGSSPTGVTGHPHRLGVSFTVGQIGKDGLLNRGHVPNHLVCTMLTMKIFIEQGESQSFLVARDNQGNQWRSPNYSNSIIEQQKISVEAAVEKGFDPSVEWALWYAHNSAA